MAETVIDVTFAERLVGKKEQPESWKEGLDVGLEFGGKRIAQLTLDLSLCRTKLVQATSGAQERERLMQHWRAEAQWWKEEFERVHAEYCAFVAEMAKRFAR